MSTEEPPDTNAIAERLWQLGRQGARLGDILQTAQQAGGRLLAVTALRDAFDLSIHDAVDLVVACEDSGSGSPRSSADELGREHGAKVRAALRPRARRTVWIKNPQSGWMGQHEE